jgi:hypothetical protein
MGLQTFGEYTVIAIAMAMGFLLACAVAMAIVTLIDRCRR